MSMFWRKEQGGSSIPQCTVSQTCDSIGLRLLQERDLCSDQWRSSFFIFLCSVARLMPSAIAACETLPLARATAPAAVPPSPPRPSRPAGKRQPRAGHRLPECQGGDAFVVQLQRDAGGARRAEHQIVPVDGQQSGGGIGARRDHQETGAKAKAERKRLSSMRIAASRTVCVRIASVISLTSSRHAEMSRAAATRPR